MAEAETAADRLTTYAKFIEAELKAEHDRRTALDARAATVATSSSAFIALSGALTVLATGKDYAFTGQGARGVLLTLASFLVSAAFALVASGSRTYAVATADTLDAMLGADHWTDDEATARLAVSVANVKTIRSLRRGNNRKAGLLVIAHVFQVLAVAGFIVTLAWELRDRII